MKTPEDEIVKKLKKKIETEGVSAVAFQWAECLLTYAKALETLKGKRGS